MKAVHRSIALLALFLAMSLCGRAELFQVVRIVIISENRVRVERVECKRENLAEAIKAQLHNSDRVAVKMFVQVGTRKDIVEAYKAECRKAGVSQFTIVTKA